MRLERGLAGDIRWAVCVLAGMALAILVFGESAALLLAPAVVAAVIVAVRALLRHQRARPRTG
jgi:hypothetical protein